MSKASSYAVRITDVDGVAYLVHRGRHEWSRRQAQRHAKDVREGQSGIKQFTKVEVTES